MCQVHLIRAEESDLSRMQLYFCTGMVGDADLSCTDHAEAKGRMGVLGKVPKGFEVLLELCVDPSLMIF